MHPAALIVQARSNFEFIEKMVNSKLRPKQFGSIKEEIEKRISHYNCLTDASMKSHSLDNDEKIKQYQDNGRRDILLSTIDPEFLSKYQEDIQYEKTYEDLLKFLSDTIGSHSEKQKAREAEARLSTETRYINENEKFTRFLSRINRIANDASNQPSIREYLVENTFRKNLTPRHNSFLREHEKSEDSIQKIAEYLDKMRKNVADVSVNSLELEGATQKISELYRQNSELHAQNNKLHQKFDALQEDMKRVMVAVTTQNPTNQRSHQNASSIELNQVNQNGSKNEKRDTKNAIQSMDRRRFWDRKPDGTPVTCDQCGLWGHFGKNCRRTTRCAICQTVGHSKFICPQNKSNNVSKNL